MSTKARIVFFLAGWLFFVGGIAIAAGQEKAPERAPGITPHARGVAHFERGFYEFLPKNRAAEAAAEFASAIREFKSALELDPSQAETHRALARVYRVQEKYLLAAEQYQKVTELNPLDIDAYVLAAEALAEAGRYEESGLMLQKAKTRTADPGALRALDGYLQKLSEAGRESGQND
jgi:tetratricopeptide (TPR) repeat protein